MRLLRPPITTTTTTSSNKPQSDTAMIPQDNTQFENLMNYDPILTQCIANWLWTNYKINDHPYFDLHIVNLFSDLPQAVHFCKSIMEYYRWRLPGDKFSLVHFHLVPLYPCGPTMISQSVVMDLMRDIPGDGVELVLDSSVFPLDKVSGDFSTDDPVYILMMNDVMKVLSQDLVRFNSESCQWEQCYIDRDPGSKTGGYEVSFKSSMEFWCDRTLSVIKESGSSLGASFYIPTQLVQLFDAINLYVPNHHLLLIDSPVSQQSKLLRKLKSLLGYNNLRTAEAIETPEGLRFKNDFTFIQCVLNNLNQSARRYEVMSLGELVDVWTEARVKRGSTSSGTTTGLPAAFTNKLRYQLRLISDSSLQVLYS